MPLRGMERVMRGREPLNSRDFETLTGACITFVCLR
jgi:hypothetical protein